MRVDGGGRGYADVCGIGPHPVQLGPLFFVSLHRGRTNGWLFEVVIVPGCLLDLILSMSLFGHGVGHGVWEADLLIFLVWGCGHVEVVGKAPSWQPDL